MPPITKILLPIDLNGTDPAVVHQISALAHHYHSEVVLLYVVTPMSYAAGSLPPGYVPRNREDLLQELIRQAEKQLETALGPEFVGLSVKRIVLEGSPVARIVETARKEKASLIAMPTHGYGTFRRFLLGSVTAKVLHDSELPVWTGAHLEHAPADPFAIRNVVCAVDLSAHSRRTAEAAASLASDFSAKLVLAHVTAGLQVYAADGVANAFPEWQDVLSQSAAKQIQTMQKSLNTNAEVAIDSGDVAAQLYDIVRRAHGDVLVVGRRSAGHLGGTGYGIIRQANVPVLSV